MRDLQALRHHIRMKFGTSHSEPTDHQLSQIIDEIESVGQIRTPTERDWRDAVFRYCPSAGTWHYEGLDNSDLNELLGQMGGGRKDQGSQGTASG